MASPLKRTGDRRARTIGFDAQPSQLRLDCSKFGVSALIMGLSKATLD